MCSVITSRSDNSVFKMLDTVLSKYEPWLSDGLSDRPGDPGGHSTRSTAFPSHIEGVAYPAIL
jgi:hypothetical protein